MTIAARPSRRRGVELNSRPKQAKRDLQAQGWCFAEAAISQNVHTRGVRNPTGGGVDSRVYCGQRCSIHCCGVEAFQRGASPLPVAPLDAEREREGAATNAAENLRRERVQIRK